MELLIGLTLATALLTVTLIPIVSITIVVMMVAELYEGR